MSAMDVTESSATPTAEGEQKPVEEPKEAEEKKNDENAATAPAQEETPKAAEPTQQAPTESTEPSATAPEPEKKESGAASAGDSDITSTMNSTIPTRQYLDQTVVPILLQALGALAKERPPNPIEYLANYLLKEKDRFAITPSDATPH
ncbi:unnamed protein product [Anisakis simplex]|uniref:Dosage compensation protein dpy-30 (inferred by orthology to a C. elegans protein) n=1 Tax=Anisakis simplex TaxID=6269 RepID=A0A0M3JGY9_ANISI|nr:unnamed protein product [Anisakis simplex]